jgi:hypothetical protein
MIGAEQWTCKPKEKHRLLYAIFCSRITISLSGFLIDLFDLNLMQERSRFDLSDDNERYT